MIAVADINILSHFVSDNISPQGTKREISSKIDSMGHTLDANTEIIQQTGREVCLIECTQILLFHSVVKDF